MLAMLIARYLTQALKEKLLDGWTPEPKKETTSKNGAKRQAPAADTPESKRQKKPEHTKQRAVDSGEVEQKRKSPEKKRKRTVDQADGENGATSPSNNKHDASDDDAKSEIKVELPTPAVDEEEEYSDVIDEPAKPKRKKKERKESTSKASKPSVKKTTVHATPDDPEEAEIKKLQSQLVKCGVRKLWHNELKEYGDDARAKIRHLKKMLAEIGMDGRFSEAKAREIKETRELLADAEAAQEMNKLWGMDNNGRASRSKVKSMKLDESDGSDEDEGGKTTIPGKDDDNDDDDDADQSFAARRRRAQADLAFLGDDSDSD